MSEIQIQPDRIWQPRHPLMRRVGRKRNWIMLLLLLLLWSIIAAYIFFTNENRVRSIAAEYLGNLVGGQVRIGGADLSLFEGLRLWDVQLTVPDGDGPQSTLLEAGTVFISCNARELLSGHLAAKQIVIVEPHVRLAEHIPSGTWNYDLLSQRRWSSGQAAASEMTTMPEILLRDAQVDYLEVRDGRPAQVGWMAVAGHFSPLGQSASGAPKYEFSFQSRGRHGLGPAMTGVADLSGGRISAGLENVVFGPDTRAMLPSPVSRWCRDHALAGRMSVKMDYLSGGFRVTDELDGVQISVSPNPAAPPITFDNAHGELIFTNDGITAKGLTLSMENNPLSVEGSLGGYSPDDSMDITLHSVGELNIAKNLPSIESLPPAARDLYDHFHPWGRATASIRLQRAAAAAPVHCLAQIDVLDAGFTFANVPYPISHVSGQVLIGPDKSVGFDTVRMVNLVGRGPDGSANQNARIAVNGWIGPFDKTSGGAVDVEGTSLADEPLVRSSLSLPARRTLELLDSRHEGFGASPKISFISHAVREKAGVAENLPWIVSSDLSFSGAQAVYAHFPYRLEKISGKIEVRDGYLNIVGVQGQHANATVLIGGRVDFNKDGSVVTPDLRVAADDLPIDKDLLAALPRAARDRLTQIGLGGTLDVLGSISGPQPGYDFGLTLHDGSLSPRGVAAITGITGDLELTPGRLQTSTLSATRGAAALTGRGWVDWSGSKPTAWVSGHARNLNLDENISALLPPKARDYWAQLNPTGTVDADLVYDTANTATPMQLNVRPVQLSVAPRLSPQSRPLNLNNVAGWLDVAPGHVATWDITADQPRAGSRPGQIAISGAMKLDDPAAAWEVHLTGKNLTADPELLQSLPPGLADVLRSLQLTGGVGFEFTKLSYRPASTTQPSAGADADFAVEVHCEDGSIFVGVPMDSVHGDAALTGSIRNGTLHQLDGDLSADTLRIAARSASNLSAHISKPADEQTVHVSALQAVVAGGDLAGDLAVGLSDDKSPARTPQAIPGVNRYAISLILSGADVSQLAGGSSDIGAIPDAKLNGRLTASLQLSGSVNDPNARRGRGTVTVVGTHMYQLPLLLGLLQITNLALPISTPFERAVADYSVQGQRVTLEKIQIGGRNISIQGSGHLDFASNQVDLNFTTDNPGWLSVPIFGPVWSRAQNELLRIHVKGSISRPKVSASSFDTFTTTVDQVFKGAPDR